MLYGGRLGATGARGMFSAQEAEQLGIRVFPSQPETAWRQDYLDEVEGMSAAAVDHELSVIPYLAADTTDALPELTSSAG